MEALPASSLVSDVNKCLAETIDWNPVNISVLCQRSNA